MPNDEPSTQAQLITEDAFIQYDRARASNPDLLVEQDEISSSQLSQMPRRVRQLLRLPQRIPLRITQPETMQTLREFYQSHILNRENVSMQTLTECAHRLRLAEHDRMTFNVFGFFVGSENTPLNTLFSTLTTQLRTLALSMLPENDSHLASLSEEGLKLHLVKTAVFSSSATSSGLRAILDYAKKYAPRFSFRAPAIIRFLQGLLRESPNLNSMIELSDFDRVRMLSKLALIKRPKSPHFSLLYEVLILDCMPNMMNIIQFEHRRTRLRTLAQDLENHTYRKILCKDFLAIQRNSKSPFDLSSVVIAHIYEIKSYIFITDCQIHSIFTVAQRNRLSSENRREFLSKVLAFHVSSNSLLQIIELSLMNMWGIDSSQPQEHNNHLDYNVLYERIYLMLQSQYSDALLTGLRDDLIALNRSDHDTRLASDNLPALLRALPSIRTDLATLEQRAQERRAEVDRELNSLRRLSGFDHETRAASSHLPILPSIHSTLARLEQRAQEGPAELRGEIIRLDLINEQLSSGTRPNSGQSVHSTERNPRQSAHGTVVHEDIVKALHTLYDLYHEGLDVDANINAMRTCLNSVDIEKLREKNRGKDVQHILVTAEDPQAYLKAAKATFNRLIGYMKNKNYRHFNKTNYCGILALVWSAIHDDNRCQGNLAMRQEGLLRSLYEVNQSYLNDDAHVDAGNATDSNAACPQGHMAILIAGLNSVHKDIEIRFMSGKIVLDSAAWYAQSSATSTIETLIRDNNIVKAEATLKQCYDPNRGIADALSEETKMSVCERLQQEFQEYFNTPATDTRFAFDKKVSLDEAMELYRSAVLSDAQVTDLVFTLVRENTLENTETRVRRILELDQASLYETLRNARELVAEAVLTRCHALQAGDGDSASPSTPRP
ncbi:MAG: hypothetical protein DHS20C10_07270 [marine bacterium B5-7]|nr:MAG: hypothetical protein DHS20C10_07270 [marine bacterium B5-7]